MNVEDLSVDGVRNVSFQLKAGEILGLVGLRGAGHQEVGRALFGITEDSTGTVHINGEVVKISNPEEALKLGVAFLSSKRSEESLAPTLYVRENIYLNPITDEQNVLSVINKRAERNRCDATLQRFTVKPRDGERIVSTLSGGNQQKVILARLFETGSRILILEEPTFGVDVGAKADIYALMERGLAEGKGILLISSDFEEVAGICHRAIVFYRGIISAEVSKAELSIKQLTGLASGIAEDSSE
jgi:ribose transport system ATP-binding protein